MLIGLISDTHDQMERVLHAADLFHQRGVERILHAGDMCSPPAMRVLLTHGTPTSGVLGNNDGEVLGLAKILAPPLHHLEPDLLEMDLPEGRLALYHGTSKGILDALIHAGTYRFVVYGHTHRADDRTVGSTRVLNPGTAHGFGKEATVMILDSATGVAEKIVLP